MVTVYICAPNCTIMVSFTPAWMVGTQRGILKLSIRALCFRPSTTKVYGNCMVKFVVVPETLSLLSTKIRRIVYT